MTDPITNIEEALFEVLTTSGALAALVVKRVYPIERPQNSALPAITYQRTGGDRDHAQSGPTGLVESRFLFFCFAEKTHGLSAYAGAKNVKRELVKVILPDGGFRRIVGAVEIQGIFITDENDSRTEGVQGVSQIARVTTDATIWHRT